MKVNYHMHTSRCHHAWGTEEEYIQSAIAAGFEEVGFADHTPWHFTNGYVSGMRMKEEELDDYIAVIEDLKQRYQNQIAIKIGLECEYFPALMPWLKRTLETKAIDYIILGNHFHLDESLHIYYGHPTSRVSILENYVQDSLLAIQTGLYSYMAHPDLIHYCDPDSQIYQDAMKRICLACKEAGMPLEFNMLGYREKRQYPCPQFWEIAAACQCQAIIGFDAHEPERLLDDQLYQQARSYLESLKIEIVDKIRFLK